MAERLNTNKTKHQRSLSASKKKGILKNGGTGKSTITSFFNNTPPSKLPCPLRGQMVPRFKVNEHIDSQCQNFQRDNNDEADSFSSTAVSKLPLSPPRNTPKTPDQDVTCLSKETKEEPKTSPYFKKQISREVRGKRVVRTLSLGSLSSKLSSKGLKSPDGSLPSNVIELCSSEEEDSGKLSSSQKENHGVTGDNKTIILATQSTSSIEVESPSEKHGGHLPPVVSLAAARLTKRKKGERSGDSGSEQRTSALSKKVRYVENSEPVEAESSKRTTGASDCSRQGSEPTSDVSCDSSLKSGTEQALVGSPVVLDGDDLTEPGAGSEAEEADTSDPPRLSYYLRNFRTVLEAVLENEDDRELFNQDDLSVIHIFERLSVPGQKLYVRLFQRKLKWLQVNKLGYAEISADLSPVVQELVDGSFLETENDLQELGEVLDLLPVPELRNLAKRFHLGGSGTPKQQLLDGLLRLSRQKSLFALAPGQNNTGAIILKKAKQLAGSCVRLHRGPRAVFSRVLLLFSLTDAMEEEDMAAGGQLYTILLVNSGRLAFPEYTVLRRTKLFRDREDLIRYEAVMRTLQEVIAAMQAGHWDDARVLYTSAKAVWQELRMTHDLSHEENLPVFLRCFTTGWAYTRVLSRGVEILQRLRRYEEAVEELRSLLGQSVYCPDSRGRWWDRIALNLQQHLKQPKQAIAAIREGLSDPLVRTGHQLSLHQRAARMKESPSFKKYRLELQDLPTIHVKDVTHVTIRGQLFPHEGGTGKSVFLLPTGEEGGDSTVMCSVEELSLAHYRRKGFDQGIHGEGSTFSTLFGLLMWDIIFMDEIPDVFRNPYQTCPLDLFTDHFYENRREAVETRVQMLREASVDTLHNLLFDTWTSQEGRECSLVSWERFSSLEQAQSLVSCMGGTFLGGVIARMAKDYRHCRAGLPDLVVWNTSNNSYKLVEVKGPSDRLSQKQLIWLDELHSLGADVEVCHVTATGARGARLE
ncbi:fanconi-associated nuclease 1 [Osmerus mordax]|uniref:fanconi-associated nuclease 1 n=1 Tax=Osmerus mordax TaxID=8014 RepID=UPI00350ED32F